MKIKVAILVATCFSSFSFAIAPVSDVTGYSSQNAMEKQIQALTRLLETRNKMQIRFQHQLDEISREVSQIKGSVEVFDHKMNQIENRQRNLYQLIEENKTEKVTLALKESTSSLPPNEKDAYQKSVNLVLVNKEYKQAIVAFDEFITTYPKSNYIANAQYWLGQLLYKEKQREKARQAFLVVTQEHLTSNKRADALFKIGIIDEYLGKNASAKIFYQKVIQEYADSSAAKLATQRLNSL
ncbi:tol-pal system protein YbgF [Psychromonas sp. CNPT3]|uniref:tol-pal system protein YbgF n=1 Tax=Psychromonas sp. CNPT3 TaxID=314282 RepID=UPI001E33044F|nr:tol-pal system protein YbgF [Psychromonas sp. CNPT3]